MRAAVFTEFEGPSAIETRERPEPEAGPGQAVVDVEAAAINNHDLYILSGEGAIGSGGPPFVSGVDLAGTVSSVGADVSHLDPGDPVVLCPNQTCGNCRCCWEGPENNCEHFALFHGSFAERAAVDADRLIALPAGVDAATAGVLPVAYMTAWHMIRRADVQPGDLVFVPGATGGVGTAAILLSDLLGAETVGTTTTGWKADRLEEIGADHVVQSGETEAIREAVEAIGQPDAVLNHMSGPFTELGVELVRQGGTVATCGSSAGSVSEVTLPNLYLENKSVVGSTMGTQADLERVLEFVANGDLDPAVGGEYALADLDDAFRDMQDRDLFGKARIVP